ncbi:glycoside hydrolase family 5 protein [Actinotalea sp. M2MS4P-6]|uniref:glycoside hydrolase family 5 protein n=1 Tax=Actinotalea sp. M2MS4P-6 TaxID=2983762 RepID=UPI0021E3CB72|nr:glycoside hydrolase family 5 protein [Actinotalea sp. M2MS4P-6]MCV2395194.1 glycoside hydrolase family 5 protein [Actinotalea sp. M2MS4P-6]
MPDRVTPHGFVRAADGLIVGPDGTPLHLRGVGLGTWLLPEGYMWGFGDAAASPRQIEALVVDLVGQERARAFWREFRDAFITRQDVELIAASGFDHVRVPINWRVLVTSDGDWLEDGFALIDRLVGWCRDAGLLALFDLHGAPGGQTGTNIDDSAGRPELFMDARNVELTVALWREIARRYRDEPTVLGYDLLNEPLPNEWQHRFPDQLVEVYRRITAAIREVDGNHLVMYEGTHWATGWEIFTEVWDPNSALQFHKYWSAPSRASVEGYLEVGRRLGLPVYMGEGGENSPEWLAAAHQLYEDCAIGWNFWTWKKIDTRTSPLSVDPPDGWDRVVDHAAGRGAPPSPAEAERILDDLLANLAVERCTPRPEITAALFRRAPVTLPAYGFTFLGAGRSYRTSGATADPAIRPGDAVELRTRDGSLVPRFEYLPDRSPEEVIVADLAAGDWLAFSVELGARPWRVVVVADRGRPGVEVDGRPIEIGADGGATEGRRWSGEHLASRAGRVTVRVSAVGGDLTIAALSVEERA